MYPIDEDANGNLIYEDGIKPFVIRTSERTNFKRCRTLWDFTSQLRENRESTRMNHNLAFGIALHVGMENYYLPEQWHLETMFKANAAITAFVEENSRQRKAEDVAVGGLSQERVDEYGQREELGIGMLRRYPEWAEPKDLELGLKPIGVELKFQVPVYEYSNAFGKQMPMVVEGRPVVYQVRVDMLAEHTETGGTWIWDHKTAGNVTSDLSFLELDVQLSSYPWAYQTRYGTRVEGVVYNELEKTLPKPPKINKNGSLSQDKRQLTTYKLFKGSIEELGLDPAPYEAMLGYLRDNERDYFRRTEVHRSSRELAIQGGFVVDEVRDMLVSPSIYPNPGKFNCNGCDFRGPCGVRTEGGDYEFLLNDPMLYRSRATEDNVDADTI